jgi:hypothetical protein
MRRVCRSNDGYHKEHQSRSPGRPRPGTQGAKGVIPPPAKLTLSFPVGRIWGRLETDIRLSSRLAYGYGSKPTHELATISSE